MGEMTKQIMRIGIYILGCIICGILLFKIGQHTAEPEYGRGWIKSDRILTPDIVIKVRRDGNDTSYIYRLYE